MQKKNFTLILCALLVASSLFACIKSCSANPIVIGKTSISLLDNSALHEGEFIQMPIADVEINITRISSSVAVDLVGIYEFETNQTQNASLAYVYPSRNTVPSPTYSMTVQLDSVETEFTMINWEELVEHGFSEDLLEYTSVSASFALFDVSLTANTSLVLRVDSHFAFTIRDELYWDYNYIFGSARSFEGDTWETIHIHLVEQTPFIATVFEPDDYLSLTRNGIITDATWAFNVSNIDLNMITMRGHINFENSMNFLDILFMTIVVVSLSTLVVYMVRKMMTRTKY